MNNIKITLLSLLFCLGSSSLFADQFFSCGTSLGILLKESSQWTCIGYNPVKSSAHPTPGDFQYVVTLKPEYSEATLWSKALTNSDKVIIGTSKNHRISFIFFPQNNKGLEGITTIKGMFLSSIRQIHIESWQSAFRCKYSAGPSEDLIYGAYFDNMFIGRFMLYSFNFKPSPNNGCTLCIIDREDYLEETERESVYQDAINHIRANMEHN
jgi:hypothetical protein